MTIAPGITKKIFAIAASVLLLLLIIAANTHQKIRVINAEIKYLADYILPTVQLVDDATIAMLEQEIHVERLLKLHQAPVASSGIFAAEKSARAQHYANAERHLNRALQLLNNAILTAPTSLSNSHQNQIIQGLEQIRAANQNYYQHSNSIIQRLEDGEHSNAIMLAEQTLDQEENALNEITETILEQLQSYAITTSLQAQQHQEAVLYQNALLTLITLLAGMIYAAILSKKLSGPVSELNRQVKQVLAQQQHTQVKATSHDEVALLTERFNLALNTLRRAEHLKDIFGLYLDPQLIAQLEQKNIDFNVTGERQSVTVILSNLEGIEALSSQISPEQLINLVNQYLEIQLSISREYRGILNFTLTEILSFWTHPFSEQQSQNNLACHMLLSQIQGVKEFSKLLQTQLPDLASTLQLQFRAGLTSGDLVVANMGPSGARSFTVIGDEVNAASRLKGVARFFDVNTVLSENIVRSLDEVFVTRPLGWVKVPGKDDPIKTYHLMGYQKDYSSSELVALQHFARGIELFESQKHQEAAALFQQYLAQHPGDVAADKYLKRCQATNGLEQSTEHAFYWEIAQK